jgi:hypothetical protein
MKLVDFNKNISTISMLILHVVFKNMFEVIKISCVYCMYVFTVTSV